MKINNILLITQFLSLASAGLLRKRNSEKCSCDVNPLTRKDCGYYGITEAQCIKNGCCWGATDVNGAPWCFYTASGGKTTDCSAEEGKTCEVDVYSREDCGFYGINQEGCMSRGCCWAESSINGIPWCFYPRKPETTITTTTDDITTSTTDNITTTSIDDVTTTTIDEITTTTTTDEITTTTTDEITSSPTIPVEKVCPADEMSRRDCGYIGITKNECEYGGCCWSESKTDGIPWCFNAEGKNIKIEKPAITVRFLKPEGWNTVNLWAWDADDTNLYGSVWPGKPISDLGNGWVSYTFPEEIGYVNVLFNNGNEQTSDIRGITSSVCLKLYDEKILKTVDCGLDLSVCKLAPESRVQCGSTGITAEQCADLNCCYNELDGAPSCFYGYGMQTNSSAGSCNILSPIQRTQCGNDGISEKDCRKKGCCYDELSGSPSCFNHGPNVPSCAVDDANRQQCGYNGISQMDCESNGCCFDTKKNQCFKKGAKSGPDGGSCVYTVTDLETSDLGMTAVLDLQGRTCEKYDIDFQTLDFEASFETDTRLHIHIQPTDIDNHPHNVDMPAAAYPFEIENEPINDLQYSYELIDGQDFQLQVKRNDGSVIFDGISFIFERQYLEISKRIQPDSSIYGFGEVLAPYKRNSQDTQHALFNADNATPIGQNLYGSHPFYVEIIDGKAYGFLLKNSHGMEFSIKNNVMSIQVIGGNFDMYFFMGPTMDDVVKQYYKVIGAPALLPYWSLGWHQCRYGYKDIWTVEKVVENYRKNNIPLDTMWIDIDFMDSYKDFTYDPKNFPVSEVQNFVSNLKKNHQYYVNMIDPAIFVDDNYPTYKRGIEKDIFVKDKYGKNFIGEVWPGRTVFPDWHNPNILEYWTNEIKLFKDMAMTDGNWIDMNEAANFCNGACDTSYNDPPFVLGEFNARNPPFAISHFGSKAALKTKNLDMDAQYYGGLIDYDIHNIYGHMESIVTNKALRNITPNKRPFLLSRSTFPGTGKYAAHWLGDNHSDWEHLYYSISGMLNFQFFGVPMVGSDICGFVFDSNEELCARWMELGAFNPFGRNHNGKGYRDQEPYVWGSVAEASRRALAIRYKILPYMYTLLVRTHTHSEMILYSFAGEWPNDSKAVGVDKQFLMGKGILITPVIQQGATSVTGYFPEGVWYDWYTHESFSGPTYKTLPAELVHIPVHLRGGYIIPTQGPSLTVYDNRNKPFELLIALDANKEATGRLYLDDGISIDVNGKFSEIEYTVKNGTLTATGSYNYNEAQKLHEITVLGVSTKPSSVTVNNAKVEFTFNKNELIIKNLSIDMNSDFTVTWN